MTGEISPLLGIDAAVNRRTLDGKHPKGWYPEQKVTVEEALTAYTATAAFAAGRDRDLGTLEGGKLADLVVLSRDVLAEKERDAIAEARVVMTVVGGEGGVRGGREVSGLEVCEARNHSG